MRSEFSIRERNYARKIHGVGRTEKKGKKLNKIQKWIKLMILFIKMSSSMPITSSILGKEIFRLKKRFTENLTRERTSSSSLL